jgi:microcystin-dependent protein
MDGTIGEIRGFAGNFAPVNWQICAGQVLPINSNQALYTILGALYGGDGKTTFALPDLRGKTVLGVGRGAGLTPRVLAAKVGTESTTLTVANMPAHSHSVTTSSLTVTGTATGNVTPKCFNSEGDQTTAVGNVLANINNGYVGVSDANRTMAPITANLNLNGTVTGTVTIGNSGASAPFSTMQPSLAINWIICTSGLYPPRI